MECSKDKICPKQPNGFISLDEKPICRKCDKTKADRLPPGEIHLGNQHMIINGGNPLHDCPTDWDKANEWQDNANQSAEGKDPKWRWDCGFKLDYDGSLVTVSSRFYPPKTHYGSKWDGCVGISLLQEELVTKKFEENTLEELKIAVEEFVNGFTKRILQFTEERL